jgi:hypothetical protein
MHTPTGTRVWYAARALMGALLVAAIVRQLAASVGTAQELGRDVGVTIANFFSFFTILSNTAAAIVLLWAAVWFFTRARPASSPTSPRRTDNTDSTDSTHRSDSSDSTEPVGLAVALASVSTYMIVTGIVYNLLLRQVELPQGSEPVWWSNEVLHLVGPLFLLADVLFGPLRRALPWRALGAIVAFPIVWVLYTMIRGLLVTNPTNGEAFWYPYPFLNPNNLALVPIAGYPGVILYVIGIAVAILAVGTFVVWWGRRSGRAPGEEDAPIEASAAH